MRPKRFGLGMLAVVLPGLVVAGLDFRNDVGGVRRAFIAWSEAR